MYVELAVCNKTVKFQLDCGVLVSIINLNTYNRLNKPPLVETKRILHDFGKTIIRVLGELHTNVKCGQREEVTLIR